MISSKPFEGLYTALITPFKNDKLDTHGLKTLIQRQVEAEVAGIVALGTTGEAPTLSQKEKEQIVKICKEECDDLHFMVGTGSNSTHQTIETTKWAADLGAQSALVIAPYYNRPTQAGLLKHFESVADTSPIPIIIYNNPSRCAVNINPETVHKLAVHPSISAIKEASESVSQIEDSLYNLKKVDPNFTLLTGNDPLTLAQMALGIKGSISIISNLYPKQIKALVAACQHNDFIKARSLQETLIPVFNAFSLEPNPLPIKCAMDHLGLPAGAVRLPLVPLSQKSRATLIAAIEDYEKQYG